MCWVIHAGVTSEPSHIEVSCTICPRELSLIGPDELSVANIDDGYPADLVAELLRRVGEEHHRALSVAEDFGAPATTIAQRLPRSRAVRSLAPVPPLARAPGLRVGPGARGYR
jgi:hypothetical protein